MQTQAQYRDWANFIAQIVATAEEAGRDFGIVQHADLAPAFEAGVSAKVFVAQQIERTDRVLAELAALRNDPAALAAWRLRRIAKQLDEDAAAGFTRD